MGSSEDLAYSIADEIGSDISFVRLNVKDELGDRQYLTGIEIGVLIGTGVLTSFCIAFIKSISEKIGEELGKLTAKTILDQLHKIKNEIRESNLENEDELLNQVHFYQNEIDKLITTEVPKLISNRTLSEEINSANQYEIQEIKIYLIDSGFTHEKSAIYSERIVKRIQQEWIYE